MGTNSRATRSRQNSSGKRTTRSTATPSVSSPTNHISPLASSFSTISRPGSALKAHAAAHRGSGRAPATAKRKLPPPSPTRQSPPQEEILAEIVVSTNGLDELDEEMSEDEAEMMDGAGPSPGPSIDAPESFPESEFSSLPHAEKTTSQPPPGEPVLAEPEVPKPVSFTGYQTCLPSSIEPSVDEEFVEERAPRLDIDEGAIQMACSKVEALVDHISKDKASTEPAEQESIPTESNPVHPASAPVKAETVDKRASQLDIQDATPQVLPVAEVTPCAAPQGSTTADTALARSMTYEPYLNVQNAPMAKTQPFEQQAFQAKVENGAAQVPYSTKETMPKPTAQDLPAPGLIHEESTPTDFKSDTSQISMTSPIAQDTFQSEEAKEDPALDEPTNFDDVMDIDLDREPSATPGLVDRDAIDGRAPDLAFPRASPEDSGLIIPIELNLDSNVVPSLILPPSGPLANQDSASNGISEREDVAQSPAEQSEPVDTALDNSVPPRGELALDLDDNPLALELRRAIDPSIIPSLEKFPPATPSEAEPSSFGGVSNEDIEEAFEESAKAGPKCADMPLTDTAMGDASISDGLSQSRATAVSALGTDLGDEPSRTHYLREAAPSVVHSSNYAITAHHTPVKSTLKQIVGEERASFASSSSLSALTDISGLSSKPPSVSSKATTPFDVGSPRETLGHFTPGSTFQVRSAAPRLQFNVRPKVSIPADLTPQEYAMECIEAGENSRLNAYALHQEEYLMLRSHISHGQVTTYLNIRNGILRLWVRNPQIAVTREEAIGCARDTRWFDVANVCFDWLVRRGYINYGCVEVRQSKSHNNHVQPRKQKTVVVIGAGFSGLGCARQLEGLFKQYSKRFREMDEESPRVVVLEGRNRVGGRVYSRAFETLPATAPGVMRGRRFTAEMGGMIITGFERGNPLNILVRGQLGLPYHCLLADMSLHDSNGTNVDLQRDTLVEQLYNACLERVSEYKFKTQPTKLIEGNRDLMDEGRDSSAEGHKTIALVEETTAAQPHAPPVSQQNVAPQVDMVPVSTNRMTGKVHTEPGTAGSTKAAFKAKQIGWTLKAGVSEARDIDLDPAVDDPNSTLGSVLDNALMQHKDILDLNAQDFRLFNWHIANLEYSNATNLNRLSAKGWDVDVGNEWDGRHTMVVGGYQSVARGLATLPTPLDIQHKAVVKRIEYASDGSSGPARIILEDGNSVDADYVVNTIPLGVLKHGNVEFQPPLPSWKTQAIDRLGFGVLNKVILVYKEAFWDKDRDIFGMLQTPTNRSSLNQKDYASRRGRFFQWFSVTNTTGMPCLLALMAGDAAYDTEVTPNDELIAEATEVLRMRYGARVMQPLEAIVTRWESDRFARGSYSNAGVNMQPDDYQLMARAIGNLHFAGEHTIVTHPATVHGAYLSGLRAASDVLDAMLGPIDIPAPLVLPRETSASLKRKAQEEHKDPAHARLEAYEMEIMEHIHATIGPYPLKPAKVAGNPYIIFNKANYEFGRQKCEEGRRAGKGKPSPNEVRTMTSKMWKEASPEVRKPFEDAAEEQKRAFAKAVKEWTEAAAKWEREAAILRERYTKEHPSIPGAQELVGGSNDWNGARRAKRMVESYREEDSDVDMD